MTQDFIRVIFDTINAQKDYDSFYSSLKIIGSLAFVGGETIMNWMFDLEIFEILLNILDSMAEQPQFIC